jgi:general secretion pathway protein E
MMGTSPDDTDDKKLDDLDSILDADDLDDVDEVIEDEIPKLVTQLLEEAVRVGASAIHLEPTGGGTIRARLRVGPALREGPAIPRGLERGVVGRLKVLGRLDITERRLPQWGEFTSNLETGPTVALRVVTLPGSPDERITVHVSPLDTSPPRLDETVAGDGLEEIRAALDVGRGVVLVAGLRWSGADRLLEACVRETAQPDRAVVSIAETFRAAIPNVHQVVVRPEGGMDTVIALRAAVRSAVDVIHVHSLHDPEALRWGVNAGLQGSLLLASIPTGDVEDAVFRLLEAPIAPALVVEAVSLIIGVRQIRRLCPRCRKRNADGGFIATGCDECGRTGYAGTVPVYHVMRMDGAIRRAVRSADPDTIVTAIRAAAGTLRDAGLRVAGSGEISVVDALRETPDPAR